jgi:competence protein ComEA
LKKWWWIIFWGLASLAAAALIYWIALPPPGEPIRLLPAPTQSPYEVYVVGAVARPGVYSLTPGSRVKDAIQDAGGLLADADQEAINMAAFIIDGDSIRVPTQKAPTPTRDANALPASPAGRLTPEATPGPVNINTATIEELDTLPGIGPAIAARIVAYRQLYGAFKTIEDLMKVEGIGPAVFTKLKDFVTTGL